MGFRHVRMSRTYKYVSCFRYGSKDVLKWKGTNVKGSSTKEYDTERGAALAVDKMLLEKGFEPVNILVRK